MPYLLHGCVVRARATLVPLVAGIEYAGLRDKLVQLLGLEAHAFIFLRPYLLVAKRLLDVQRRRVYTNFGRPAHLQLALLRREGVLPGHVLLADALELVRVRNDDLSVAVGLDLERLVGLCILDPGLSVVPVV